MKDQHQLNIHVLAGGLLGGLALANVLNRGQSRNSRRFRGRRDASREDASLASLVSQEPEDCYKMVLCAANTGK